MTDTNEYEPPEPNTGDTAHLAAKEILSLIFERKRESILRLIGAMADIDK